MEMTQMKIFNFIFCLGMLFHNKDFAQLYHQMTHSPALQCAPIWPHNSNDIYNKDTLHVLTPSILLPSLQTPSVSTSQTLYTSSNTAKPNIIEKNILEKYSYHWVMYYDYFTTLTATHYIHSSLTSEVNHIYYYYNIDIKNNIEFRKLKWDLYLFNDYGVRYFMDSLTLKTQDQFNLKNTLCLPLWQNILSLSLSANTQTQLFNTHQYRYDSLGQLQRYLYDGYMSPGVIIYSGGITYQDKRNILLSLGLGSSKVTKIKNQKIFETRNEETISGLSKGKIKESIFGITLTATVPMQHLNQKIHWEFYGNAFAPMLHLKQLKEYTLEINNVIHLLVFRRGRLSLRTKLAYNKTVQPWMSVQNQLSLGFYLNNHI